jgi:hypothetical protein
MIQMMPNSRQQMKTIFWLYDNLKGENTMSNSFERLKTGLENGMADLTVLSAVEREFGELRTRVDELEELLIMIVRTGWPWDEDGEPNVILHAARDGYAAAMVEARGMLGLDRRSVITRTEPRT